VSAARWAGAAGLSVAAHAALLGFLAVAVTPVPQDPTPPPDRQIDIAAEPVSQRAAAPQAPEPDIGRTRPAVGQNADPAAIPQTRASPQAPAVSRLAADAATGAATASLPLPAPSPSAIDASGRAARRVEVPAPQPALSAENTARPAPIGTPVPATAEPATAESQTLPSVSQPADRLAPGPVETEVAPALAEVGTTAAALTVPAPDAVASGPAARPLDAAAPQPIQLASAPAPATVLAAAAPATAANAQAVATPSPMAAVLRVPTPTRLPRAAPPAPTSAARVETAGTSAVPADPDTAALLPDTPAAPPAAAARPDTDRLDAGTTDAPRALPAWRATIEALAMAADGTDAAAIPATGREVVATLAWTGGAEGRLDAQSVTAIGAFMRPATARDPDGEAADVRDAIAQAVGSVQCGRLQTTFRPETGELELRGHVPDPAIRPDLVAQLQAQVGAAVPVTDRLLILPEPQCGALAGVEAVGLPQSTEQLTNPRVIGPDTHTRAYLFRAGDRLRLDLQAPDYDSFVYVDYFDASGQVIHLVPNAQVPLRLHAPEEDVIAGDGAGLDITIGPPFGQEIVVAFAASRPLFDGLRPLAEPAGPYLQALRDSIAAARAADPDFKGEWVYVFVSTRP
jgi:hypothetical protein